MPLIDQPFKKVGVDLIGPLYPTSNRGHRYILVVVDFSTRYPEAVPLKRIDSTHVADALWEIWTRVGIPEEILTDRGAQFTSDVMKQVHQLLSAKGTTTTPYHAQCNGLVERFNGTLKTMLRRLCMETPKEWDRYIPALLFAYREVPQESTGFSPFELLYGRTVRGPMKVLKQLWTKEEMEPEKRTVAEYVIDLRNKMETMCELAHQNLEKGGQRHARYFNFKAQERHFQPGEKVLLLLPSNANKLEVAWQGPYAILEKVRDHDYKIQIGRKIRMYHANLLKRYEEREPEVSLAVIIDDTEGGMANEFKENDGIPVIPLEATEGPADVLINDALSEKQREQIDEILCRHSACLTDIPRRANISECEIKLIEEKPVRVRQYPLAYSQTETIMKEVDAMLKMGVIEPCASPYNAPIVLVKKKSGGDQVLCGLPRLEQGARIRRRTHSGHGIPVHEAEPC